jgi:plasmid maintenance system antidote protein VapI
MRLRRVRGARWDVLAVCDPPRRLSAGAIFAFTESVVREMERLGLTRTALAERLGATPAYVTKILRGKVNFTLATMVRLARALGAELHVRLAGSSRGRAARAVGEASRASSASARRSGKVVATAARPAALRSRQSARSKPRPAPPSRRATAP